MYLTEGEMMVIYKLQSHIKRGWATTYHSRFRVVARDTEVQVRLSHNLSFQIQSCSQRQKFPWSCLWLVVSHKKSIWGFYSFSRRRLQLLSSFCRIPVNASSILEVVVILKPSQVLDLPYSRLKVSLFKKWGALPLVEDLNFLLDLEEFGELHIAF